MVNLLVLVRFQSADGGPGIPAQAMDAYVQRVLELGGQLVDREQGQLMVCISDVRWAVLSLRNLLADARRQGYGVRAAVVQGVLSGTGAPGGRLQFTERTLETLLRLADSVGPLEVGITPKLMSVVQLAAPEVAGLFSQAEAAGRADPPGLPRTSAPVLMRG